MFGKNLNVSGEEPEPEELEWDRSSVVSESMRYPLLDETGRCPVEEADAFFDAAYGHYPGEPEEMYRNLARVSCFHLLCFSVCSVHTHMRLFNDNISIVQSRKSRVIDYH